MKMRSVLFILSLVCILEAKADPPTEEGKAIFNTRCASCHNVNKKLTGPALAGIDKRRSKEWIIAFVKSSQSLIKKGDKEAVELFEQFNRIPMPDHPDLTEENIMSIVEYVQSETKTETNTAPFVKPVKARPPYRPFSLKTDAVYLLTYVALVGVLIVVLLFFVNVMEAKRKISNIR